MDDMAGKISELLSDPDSLENLKNMAQMFMQGSSETVSPPPSQEEDISSNSGGPSPFSGFDLGGLNPADMAGIIKVINTLKNNKQDDKRANLLLALKPHLSHERHERVDTAVKLLKMVDLLPLINETGILKGLF